VSGRATCHIWPRLARANWSRYLPVTFGPGLPSKVTSWILHTNYFRSKVASLSASFVLQSGVFHYLHLFSMNRLTYMYSTVFLAEFLLSRTTAWRESWFT
jgi:hypothetical protein